jgi:hypothetical protein
MDYYFLLGYVNILCYIYGIYWVYLYNKEIDVDYFIKIIRNIVETSDNIKIEVSTDIPVEPTRIIKYEEKYMDEYKKHDIVELSKEQLDNLKNNIIIEKTPLGNIIMYYSVDKGAFVYYSDSTMPYRYLETAGRRYVTRYNCKSVFVDMDQMIKEAEEKLANKKDKEEKLKELREQEKDLKNQENVLKPGELVATPSKNVFAKFKTYNNDSVKTANISSKVNQGAAIKSNSTNTVINNAAVLKENANMYCCEGKLANFNFLKKIDKKLVDKRLNMSFADYKRQIELQNKI